MVSGSFSQYATCPIHSRILKGPYRLGRSFLIPLTMRFLALSQMSSPCISYLSLQLSLLFCRVSSCIWASFLASSKVRSLSTAIGATSLRNLTFTWGSSPRRSLCGDAFITSCFYELWAYSAIGRSMAQFVCLPVVQCLRYPSIQVFILSICPSVLRWNAVEMFCWMPILWQRV
jgi:hypothetical protein